jgi:hypothetical protein
MSYNQSLFFGTVAEPRLMPDVEFMKSCIADAFEELKAAALGVIAAADQSAKAAEQPSERDSPTAPSQPANS